ncbi:MAG: tetratricopeptide repeat protein [Treponema sp.]|nr:tetratricopeptide repeat protein [Candidatus Treponema equifaecale]
MADNELLLKRAKAALLARDYQLASKLFKQLITENPDVVDYKIQLAKLYVKSGNDAKALDIFSKLPKEDFNNLTILMEMSGIYRRQKKYEDSVAVLEQALMICADSSEDRATINYNLGFTYRLMGNNKEALSCFEEVIEQNPEDVLAYNHIGAIHAQTGAHDKAIEAYLQGLKFDPNHPVLQFNIAKSYSEIGKEEKALSHYEAALRARPGWLDAIEEYANLLLKNDKVKEADDVVTQALKLNPDDVKMHTSMGNVYNRKNIFETAEQEFKKALSVDDEYKLALTGLAHSQEKQGKHEEAAETIQKAQKVAPDDVAVIKQTAHILLSANYLSAAYEKISKLWEINQNDPQTVNLLGQYYIAKGDEGKIESCFDKLQTIDPDYKDVYRDWGERYLQKGDEKNAEQYLQAAVQENPKDAESMIFLAELYENQQNPEKALAMYKQASRADNFNQLSRQETMRLTDGGIASVNFDLPKTQIRIAPIDSDNGNADDLLEKSEKPQDNKIPDLLNDTSSSLNDDFADSSEEEISMAEDDSNFNEDFPETAEEEPQSDDDFNFDQFGMEKLSVESEEDIVSVESLMHLDEDISTQGEPMDIDQLVDDGSPVDEDDDPEVQFIPDGSDISETEPEPVAPKKTAPKPVAAEPEEMEMPEPMPESVQNEPEPEPEMQEETEPVQSEAETPFVFDETIHDLEEQIKAATDLAATANETAERAIKAAEEAFEKFSAANEAEVSEEESEEESVEEFAEETEETENTEDQLDELEESDNDLSPNELMIKRAIDMLPQIVSAIENRTMLYKFRSSLEMFKSLREMLDYLPEMQRKEFLTSKNRLLLDYIISKLSGKPGLFATAKALVNSGIIHENPALSASSSEGVELTKEVVDILKNLSENLTDETLKEALNREGDDLKLKL